MDPSDVYKSWSVARIIRIKQFFKLSAVRLFLRLRDIDKMVLEVLECSIVLSNPQLCSVRFGWFSMLWTTASFWKLGLVGATASFWKLYPNKPRHGTFKCTEWGAACFAVPSWRSQMWQLGLLVVLQLLNVTISVEKEFLRLLAF